MAMTEPKGQSPCKLNYIECSKRGFHYGEVLNMVCVEASCLQNLVCCCACIEEHHKDHLTKPLKLLIRQAQARSENLHHTQFDINKILLHISQSQSKTLQDIQAKRNQINSMLDKIENVTVGHYGSIVEKVKIKNSDPRVAVQAAFKTIYTSHNAQQFTQAVKVLASIVPKHSSSNAGQNPQQPETEQLAKTEQQIISSIKTANEQIQCSVARTLSDLTKNLSGFSENLEKTVNAKNIFASTNYKFTENAKHANVKLTSQYSVKSINTSGYKFAVMQPGLQRGGAIKTYAFKVKESTSNWVAVGMCHKNLVASKNFGFNFGGIGHGGYLVSANGGSWSNIKAEFNNSIKSFKFVKGDVIVVTTNFETNKIVFKKKNESYELDFKPVQGDELYPCALFYYINDEIESLPNYKEELE